VGRSQGGGGGYKWDEEVKGEGGARTDAKWNDSVSVYVYCWLGEQGLNSCMV
jgi:hypothetical protein